MLYRAPAAEALIVVPLDAFAAVFHRPSGITHLLVSPAPEILAALGAEGRTLDGLIDALREEYDLVDADPAALAARLDELRGAGLVTTA